MSVQAISWALGCKTEKSSDKFVLVVLANYSDQDGFCWPHVGTIAELTMLSVRAVRRCITRLDGAFITVEKQRGTFGQQASSHYFLDLNSEIIVQSDILSPSVQSDIDAPPECHPRRSQSEPAATYSNDEPSYIYVNNTLVQDDALFDVWWALYPRKQDKKKAIAAWTKQGCDKNADSLIDTLRNQIANDAQYSGDQQYIPLPSSYLNKEKFNDEIVIRSRTEPRETSAEAAERELAAWAQSHDGASMAGHDAVVPNVAIDVWSDAITDVD